MYPSVCLVVSPLVREHDGDARAFLLVSCPGDPTAVCSDLPKQYCVLNVFLLFISFMCFLFVFIMLHKCDTHHVFALLLLPCFALDLTWLRFAQLCCCPCVWQTVCSAAVCVGSLLLRCFAGGQRVFLLLVALLLCLLMLSCF